jgi:hypothetical protein
MQRDQLLLAQIIDSIERIVELNRGRTSADLYGAAQKGGVEPAPDRVRHDAG